MRDNWNISRILSMDISNIKVENKRKNLIELLESEGINEDKGNRRILKLSSDEQQRVTMLKAYFILLK